MRGRRLPAIPKVILITGASQGLGEGLALKYAKPGVTLGLTGRNKQRLNAVAEACAAKGAHVLQGNMDVTDRDEMAAFILKLDDASPVDLVIANAGVSEETAGVAADVVAATRTLYDVNVGGVFNTVLPLIPRMKERKRGQIAIMSSLAGTSGFPTFVAYRRAHPRGAPAAPFGHSTDRLRLRPAGRRDWG